MRAEPISLHRRHCERIAVAWSKDERLPKAKKYSRSWGRASPKAMNECNGQFLQTSFRTETHNCIEHDGSVLAIVLLEKVHTREIRNKPGQRVIFIDSCDYGQHEGRVRRETADTEAEALRWWTRQSENNNHDGSLADRRFGRKVVSPCRRTFAQQGVR